MNFQNLNSINHIGPGIGKVWELRKNILVNYLKTQLDQISPDNTSVKPVDDNRVTKKKDLESAKDPSYLRRKIVNY